MVNNYLTGRKFLKDVWHNTILKGKSFDELDKNWSESEDKSNIIVSLTTIPDRIGHMELTIKSLLFQNKLPQKIILNLPYKSFRDGNEYIIPEWLEQLDSVEIVRMQHDFGPATKFIPTLESSEKDQSILVVDDDHVYTKNYIEEYEIGRKKYPDYILCSSGWRVPEDLTDRQATLYTNVMQVPPVPVKATRTKKLHQTDIIQGYSGYLIKPRFFDLAELKDYTDVPEQLKLVDDVWISAHAKVPKFVFPLSRYCYSPLSTRGYFNTNSLSLFNNRKTRDEDRHNSIGIRYFKDRWTRDYEEVQ